MRATPLKFDEFELDPSSYELRFKGSPVKLERIPMELLLLLTSRPGELVTRSEIIEKLWGKDVFLDTDNSVNTAIRKIRLALQDDPDRPHFVLTVSGRGYRFIAPIETEAGEQATAGEISKGIPKDPRSEGGARAGLEVSKPRSQRQTAAAVYSARVLQIGTLALVLIVAALIVLYHYVGRGAPSTKNWEQLTFFTDSAVYPTLSPDGRMLAFIRGKGSFVGRGQIYVKLLPSGEPVQLTHDAIFKFSPVFSPDGARIAYGTVNPWDTWEVPVLGGESHPLLKNASSLSWIDNGRGLLFSEIKQGLHMAVVTTDEGRGQSRDVYVPQGERSMIHHSYLSPDGRWVLAVVMDNEGKLTACRVVPFNGASQERVVGPPDAICIAGAWSLDGKWVYVSSNHGGSYHIWRQRFPEGQPEQVTSGPTEEEGVWMSPDGKSLLTSVGIENLSVWVHDAKGDRQITSAGGASTSTLSGDGRKVYYVMRSGQIPEAELWATELVSGKSERVLPGYGVEMGFPSRNHNVSGDGKHIAFVQKDQNGTSHLWLAPTDHGSSPRQIPSKVSEDSPWFLPNGDLIFRAAENGLNYLYRMGPDGNGRRKIATDPIMDIAATSTDGRWVVVQGKGPNDEHPYSVLAYPVEGGRPLPLCKSMCGARWDTHGGFFYLSFAATGDPNTYVLPVRASSGLPDLPAEGVGGPNDLKPNRRVSVIPVLVDWATGPDSYSYTRYNAVRNIYRIPLP